MPVKDFKKFTDLAKLCNHTFGVSSTGKATSQSILVKPVDDNTLSAMFMIIVNYSSEAMWVEMRRRWVEEGLETIEAHLRKLEKEYKEATGTQITLKIVKSTISDSLELASYSVYKPVKTGFFRLKCNVEAT